ncbi:MAG: type II secretion system F family protein [Solirubrobacterales bacterium]|nr:type II secretion system F family protein [Solirubrobacterales bacterium]
MRRAALSVGVLGLLAFGPASAPAQERIGLVPAGTAKFPERSYRLTVPERRALRLEDVTVTENGDRVSKLSLASADGRRRGEFGTILAIDASASMKGAAIRGAMGAARALARQRSGAQQLGIIAFNQAPKVLLAPTDDQRSIDEALSRTPPLAPQTQIFDAVSSALDLLDQAQITTGSIVVLSDGSDTGSRVAADAVARRAQKANVTVFTVGLRSGAFDPRGLKDLSSSSRGRYIPAKSVSDLRRIFSDLGAQIASDSLVRYRSFAEPGSKVTVAVRVGGIDGLATSEYNVPGGASFVQVERSFWTSGLGVVVTALLCALLLAVALGILLVRRVRGPSLRERVQGFVTTASDISPAGETALIGETPRGAERSLERTEWWIAFKRDVENARITVEPMRILTGCVLATLVMAYLLVVLTGIPLVGLFALAVPWAVRMYVRVKLERQRAAFAEQLPDVLQGAASAIRAGHGLVAALSMVAQDGPEPSRTEFLRVVADEALGVPLEEALRVVQQRMGSREVLQIALVAQIQREAGGNMAEVLDRITESLRQSAELRRMVKALTAQGRLSRWVVSALPLILLLVISVLNPVYMEPMFTTALGLVMLGFAGVTMFMGSFVIGKIVNFDV